MSGSRDDRTEVRESTGDRPTPGALGAVPELGPPELRFEVGEVLGKGGMGEVAVEHDSWLGRHVARKRLLTDRLGTNAERRFLLEARVMGRLEHPNIVPVYDLGHDASGPSFVMRLVEGESLSEVVKKGKLGTTIARLSVFAKVCDALAYAHARGVVHRDVKPGNVMVGRHGEVLLLDWGCARVLGSPEDPEDPVRWPGHAGDTTTDHSVLGTPSYMAPEQALGRVGEIDERTDVYALGALLYTLLTGTPPFPGDAPDLLDRVARGAFDTPSRRAPVPRELEAIVLRAMATRREDRFPSVEALSEAVVAFQEGREFPGFRYSLGVRVAKWVYRHRRTLSAVVGLAFAATAFAALVEGLYSTRLQASLLRVTAAERASALRLAEEQVASALLDAADHRPADARVRLASARESLVRLGEPQVLVDVAESWVVDGAPPPVLAMHISIFNAVALSPDGKSVLVAPAGNADAAVFSVLDGTVEEWLQAPAPDAVPVAVAFVDGTEVVAWSKNGHLLGNVGGAPLDIALPGVLGAPPILTSSAWFVAEKDGDTRVYAVPGGALLATLAGVVGLDADRGAHRMLGATGAGPPGSGPGELLVLDVREAKPIWRESFEAVADLSPDGSKVATILDDRLTVIDLPTGGVRWSARAGHGAFPRWSEDGSVLAMLDPAHVVFFAAEDGTETAQLATADAVLRSAADAQLDASGHTVLAVARDRLTVWKRPYGTSGRSFQTGEPKLLGLAVSPDGALLAVSGLNGRVEIFDRATGQRLTSLATVPDGTRGLAFADDGSQLGTADRDGRVRVFSLLESGAPRVLEAACGVTGAVVALERGQWAAVCSSGEVLRFGADGVEMWRKNPGIGPLWDLVRSSATGALFASGREGHVAQAALIDPDSGLSTPLLEPRVGYDVAVSEDGTRFAVSDHLGRPTVMEAAPPHTARSIQLTEEVTLATALSADGRLLATGDLRGIVHLWDVDDNRLLARFPVQQAEITGLAFAPDSGALIAAGSDGHVRTLDLDLGAILAHTGGDLEAGRPVGPDPVRTLALARLAEARGGWDDALALRNRAAKLGAPVRSFDLARGEAATGQWADALRDLEAARVAGEVDAGTAAVWKAWLSRGDVTGSQGNVTEPRR